MKRKNLALITFAAIFLFIFTLIYHNFLGSEKNFLEVNGLKREYLIHSPKSSEKIPLIIALHGYKDNPRLMEFYSGLSRKADKEKFIIVYPYGTNSKDDKNLSWNGGSCCGNGAVNNVDDVGFINNLTEELIKTQNVDPKRVYIVGFSNGALLAYRIAAQSPEKYKGIAVVSGSIGGKVYKKLPSFNIPIPKKPISILAMHGMKDTRIPYLGGENTNKDGSFESFENSQKFWSKANNCGESNLTENNIVIHDSYSDCKNSIKTQFYLVKESGHVWPGSILEITKILKHQSFPATDTILNFFKSLD